MENLDPKMEHEYECVICQASTPTPQPMVLLVMMCESGCKHSSGRFLFLLLHRRVLMTHARFNYYLKVNNNDNNRTVLTPSANIAHGLQSNAS